MLEQENLFLLKKQKEDPVQQLWKLSKKRNRIVLFLFSLLERGQSTLFFHLFNLNHSVFLSFLLKITRKTILIIKTHYCYPNKKETQKVMWIKTKKPANTGFLYMVGWAHPHLSQFCSNNYLAQQFH